MLMQSSATDFLLLDLIPVKGPTSVTSAETDSQPKEISKFISPGTPKASLMFR